MAFTETLSQINLELHLNPLLISIADTGSVD
jgi:hypothetical protein